MNFKKLEKCMLEILKKYYTPGAECIVYKEHEEIFRHCVGMCDVENKIPMSGGELYLIFSMTKMLTCVCALQLFEKGKYEMSDTLSKYFPEFEKMKITEDELDTESAALVASGAKFGENIDNSFDGYAKEQITIKDLFTMSAGFDYDLDAKGIKEAVSEGKKSTQEIVGALSKTILGFEPGSRFRYSLCHDVLGALIEVWSGMKFSDYMKENLLIPLGMNNTFFSIYLDENSLSKMASLYIPDDKGKLVKLPAKCRFNLSDEYESGGAGLISCAPDYILLLDALANGGIAKTGKRILKEETINMMKTNQLNEQQLKDFYALQKGYGYGFGVRTHINPLESDSRSPVGEFGWDGAAGGFSLVDTENKLSLVYLQHCHDWDIEMQKMLKNALYEDIRE